VISLEHGFCITASQSPVAVTLAESPKLLGGKIARTCVPRGPPLAAIVRFGLPDLLGVILAPLLATGDHFVSVNLVVLAFRSAYASFIFFCPPLLVFRYLFLVFFLVFSACFYPVG
jgi:hypothetical protein